MKKKHYPLLLKSLLKDKENEIEIIVLGAGSSDGTIQIAKKHNVKTISIVNTLRAINLEYCCQF